jgi:uncharacterized protein (DUF58 family)
LLIVSIAFVLLYGETSSFVVLYSVLLLPALSFLHAVLSVRGIFCIHSTDAEFAVKNDVINYNVSITNNGVMPVFCVRVMWKKPGRRRKKIKKVNKDKTAADKKNVKLPGGRPEPIPMQDAFESPECAALAVSVPNNTTVKLNFALTCAFRGVFSLKAEGIEMLDLLGLFRFKLDAGEKIEVTVYPFLYEVKFLPLSVVSTSDTPSIREMPDEDYAVTTDLRQYRPADSFKKIHWKLSAKKMELFVKNYQSVDLNASVIVVNNHSLYKEDDKQNEENRMAAEDKLIECVVSVTHYALLRRFPVELYYADGDELIYRTGNGHEGFAHLYNFCAGVTFDSADGFADRLNDIMRAQTEFINLIVFTSEMDEALCEQLRVAKVRGNNVVLFYIEKDADSRLDEASRQLLFECGAYLYNLPFEGVIGDVFAA